MPVHARGAQVSSLANHSRLLLVSAFMGKAGALLATIVFSHMEPPKIFSLCGAVCCVGAFFTLLFSVDLTHVSLAEHDAQLELFLENRVDEYKGKLNAAEHLSLYERLTGRHGEYGKFASQAFFAGFFAGSYKADAVMTPLSAQIPTGLFLW